MANFVTGTLSITMPAAYSPYSLPNSPLLVDLKIGYVDAEVILERYEIPKGKG